LFHIASPHCIQFSSSGIIPNMGIRLGGGDFERQGGGEKAGSVNEGRCHFLAAAIEVEPEVLDSLGRAVKVLSAICARQEEAREIAAYRSETLGLAFVPIPSKPDLFRPLEESLSAWARRFNLTDSWCFAWAEQTVFDWYKSGRKPEGFIYPCTAPSGVVALPAGPFRFEAWEPDLERQAEYRQRLLQRLDRYLAVVQAAAERAGAQSVPVKRNPEHYFWLARVQVRGESIADICRNSVDGDSGWKQYDAFKKAVERTAAEIGLTLRPLR
jgi:hypothetical protein